MPLVTFVLKKYISKHSNNAKEWQDLFQVGCIGLIKAASAYDPSKGTFATLACRAITNHLFMHWKHEQAMRRCPAVVPLRLEDRVPFPDGTSPSVAEVIQDHHADVPTRFAVRQVMNLLREQSSRSALHAAAAEVVRGTMTQPQAARACGYSQPMISRTVSRMKHDIAKQITTYGAGGFHEDHRSIL